MKELNALLDALNLNRRCDYCGRATTSASVCSDCLPTALDMLEVHQQFLRQFYTEYRQSIHLENIAFEGKQAAYKSQRMTEVADGENDQC